MNFLKKYFSYAIPSIPLCALPYFAFHWIDIRHSSYFSIIQLAFILLVLILLQLVNSHLFRQNNYWLQQLSIIFYTTIILLFYGVNIVDLIYRWEVKTFHHQSIRNRIIFIVCYFGIIVLETLILKYNKGLFRIQNVFFSLFLLTTFIATNYNSIKGAEIKVLKNNLIQLHHQDSSKKPIILIISDEYSSPIELLKAFKDSSVFDFSNQLSKNGWEVKRQFHSKEISTIYSLSSLFNFNLSNDSNYAKTDENKLGSEKLLSPILFDSLLIKKVAIINYGIFDFGNYKPLTRLYFYPKNFLEQIFCYTSIPMIFYNSNGLTLQGFKISYFPWEVHNKYILKTLPDTLLTVRNSNTFCYTHLYMPHTPMIFSPEFKFHVESPENYFEYWKFTNKKLINLLKSLTQNSDYRIILTGDHGYRHYPNKMNPNETFSAFYGFSKSDIESIKSVQDLGSLINGYFK
jgi:hypothetical protein